MNQKVVTENFFFEPTGGKYIRKTILYSKNLKAYISFAIPIFAITEK